MARIGIAVAGIAAAALLAGCGGNGFADQSSDEIVKAAKADMGDLTSVKVSGELTSSGQQISLDLQTGTGGNCTGTIGIGDGSAELLGVDGQIWMKPDEAFWRANGGDSADQLIALVGDKWVVLPSTDQSFTQFCDVNQLLDQMLKSTDDGSTYAKKGTTTVDGDDVVKIENTDPKDGTSMGYVLTDDPHYLVKIEKTEGSDTGSVTFSAFNEKLDVQAPADSDVVDLSNVSS